MTLNIELQEAREAARQLEWLQSKAARLPELEKQVKNVERRQAETDKLSQAIANLDIFQPQYEEMLQNDVAAFVVEFRELLQHFKSYIWPKFVDLCDKIERESTIAGNAKFLTQGEFGESPESHKEDILKQRVGDPRRFGTITVSPDPELAAFYQFLQSQLGSKYINFVTPPKPATVFNVVGNDGVSRPSY